jgi:LysM repeat protein
MKINNVRYFRTTALTAILSVMALNLSAQRQTREEYILKYKHLAAATMERYGIPASIVMAQALLESDNGNSRLARDANNHFGIKCGGRWSGETTTHDDDARNECFRVYESVEDSFLDHGTFLDSSPRYDKLFDLREDDYKAWAHGLRECGYATNPNYGPMLIKIIEDNKLHLLDRGVEVAYADIRAEVPQVVVDWGARAVAVDDYTVVIDRATGRELHYRDGVPYIFALPGDSYGSIARDFRIGTKKLLKFNDLTADRALPPGTTVYIGRKNRRTAAGPSSHTIQSGETLHAVSQQFALRQKPLARRNHMEPDAPLREGAEIRLR